MFGHWEDTIVVFDKFRASKPSNCSLSAAKTIEERIADYVSHSTRAYKIKNTIYIVTAVTFRRSEDARLQVASLRTIKGWDSGFLKLQPRLKKVFRKMGTGDFGRGPKFRRRTPLVMYSIFEESQMYRGAQQEAHQERELRGEPLFILKGEYFKFKELCSPVTRALLAFDDKSVRYPCHHDSLPKYQLVASFVQPEWFAQGEASKIVAPETMVGDFTRLSLSNSHPSKGHFVSPMTISRVTVELQELLWGEGLQHSILPSKDLQRYERTKTLLHKYIRMECEQSAYSIAIPRRIYDCKLPELGPTFFSNHLSRSYRIHFEIRFGHLGHKDPEFISHAYMEVCVARKVSLSPKTFASSDHFFPQDSSRTLHSLMVMERFPRSSGSISEIARQAFRDVSSDKSIDYLLHETDAVTFGGDILAASKISVSQRFCPAKSAKVTQSLPVVSTSYGHHSPSALFEKKYTICEVESASLPDKQVTSKQIEALFHILRGSKVSHPQPSDSLFYKGTLVQKSNLRFPYLMNEEVSLISSIKDHAYPNQSGADPLVQPGQKIFEFLNLQLAFPMSLVRAGFKQDIGLTIERVEVVLRDSNVPTHQQLSFLLGDCFWLHDQSCEEKPPWSSLEIVSENRFKRYVIPQHLYDCHLPKWNFTPFKKYNLWIRITVSCSTSSIFSGQFEVCQRICIASSEVPKNPVQPPPYMNLDSKELKFRNRLDGEREDGSEEKKKFLNKDDHCEF